MKETLFQAAKEYVEALEKIEKTTDPRIMTLIEAAQIYTDLVNLEKEIPEQEFRAKDQANALRTKYHELLMIKMKEEGISFSDRFDAANKAFHLSLTLRQSMTVPPNLPVLTMPCLKT